MSEAKKYWITDGKRFVYRNGAGKYVFAPGEAMADMFTKKRAENLYVSMIDRLPEGFHVEESIDKRIIKQIVKSKDAKFKAVATNVGSIVEIASKFSEVKQSSQARQAVLSEQLSIVDKKISEVLHAIEFGCNYNAPGGYKVYKILRDLRRERRAIKDEMYVLSAITGDNTGPEDWKCIANRISGLDKRKYEYKYFDYVTLKMRGENDEEHR